MVLVSLPLAVDPGHLHHPVRLPGLAAVGGECLLRDDYRLFRVDGVRAAERLAETFARPSEFDLRAFLYERIAFATAPWQVEVWLDLPPDAVETRLPRAMAALDPEGAGTRLRCSATILEDIALVLLQAGCRIEIRQPAELREAFCAVTDRARTIARK